ncbi:HOOK_N domain-containing protein [Caenorhabditis elegans]|uniref:HOOK_N domain-containing protein n=1 Tax=Caenorhabditis elegans TaxID=6239 RepID=O17763_CAEEL|nr:HOOK_N domain-containing protein [Caenorhabditis elegans]CAB02893.1 HOOK_N domain-containing protein [Caenorhabditis elegans]|eukprot:NP_501873.1 Uncharacterized protein CELE_F01G10.5 [Caenorhabditis elegans]
MSVDTKIIGSFLQLTNYFAENYPAPCDLISSLTDLWFKQGGMIARMMSCDIQEFKSSDVFYEVLYRKIRVGNSLLADTLDPKMAAEGNLFEICKFYSLYLEHLRKDQSELLTIVLERLASQSDFNSTVILDMFTFFDKLYSEGNVGDWWDFLLGSEDASMVFKTPKKTNRPSNAFSTPTATAKRLPMYGSSTCRSPIAEVVDSPTMKYMRSDRELKTAKKKLVDMEHMVDELESENRNLTEKGRELKLIIDSLKSDVTNKRDTAKSSQQREQELSNILEEKEKESAQLLQQLEESRAALRDEQRHLEHQEAENGKIVEQLKTVSELNEKLTMQVKDLQDASENELASFRQKEKELIDELRMATNENVDLEELLKGVTNGKAGLQFENNCLVGKLEELSFVSDRNKQDADNARAQLEEEREKHRLATEKLHQENIDYMKTSDSRIEMILEESKTRKMMDESTIERLRLDLDNEKSYKKNLEDLLNDLNQRALNSEMANHLQKEGIQSVETYLQMAKKRIEHLELELSATNATIEFQSQQLDRAGNMLITEQEIRNQTSVQYKERTSALENQLSQKDAEIENLKRDLQQLVTKHESELKEQHEQLNVHHQSQQKLHSEAEKLRREHEALGKKNCFLGERCKIFVKDSRSGVMKRSTSSDSLAEFLSKGNDNETLEEMMRLIAQTPRKSVAFSFDLDEDETLKGTPIGFRTNLNETRESIASDEFFDRFPSTFPTRAAPRESVVSIGEPKNQFSPLGTSKDRVKTLTSRNEKVKPHLKSSYATEMGNVTSPSADEENVRKGKSKSIFAKLKGPRRDSFFFGKKKQAE